MQIVWYLEFGRYKLEKFTAGTRALYKYVQYPSFRIILSCFSRSFLDSAIVAYIFPNDFAQYLPACVITAILELPERLVLSIEHHSVLVVQMFVIIHSPLRELIA
jgi:hypothetical protein